MTLESFFHFKFEIFILVLCSTLLAHSMVHMSSRKLGHLEKEQTELRDMSHSLKVNLRSYMYRRSIKRKYKYSLQLHYLFITHQKISSSPSFSYNSKCYGDILYVGKPLCPNRGSGQHCPTAHKQDRRLYSNTARWVNSSSMRKSLCPNSGSD